MDLKQTKLTRTEWDSIELPVSESEKGILQMILAGYENPAIIKNKTVSLFSFTKIECNPENQQYLYDKYCSSIIARTLRKYGDKGPLASLTHVWTSDKLTGTIKKMKSIDAMRLQNLEANIEQNKKGIYEFLLLDFCHELCRYFSKGDTKYAYHLYTLVQLAKASIQGVHPGVMAYVNKVVEITKSHTDLAKVVERAFVFIEQNPYLLEYEDKTLFPHQKELFSLFRNSHSPKLVLYIAPTGTGKTLSPIGLSVQYRIIFVCVARHIGLALAKSAISMEKKIAFAFGAETASDVRLHYFAASDFTKDWRSGGIRKVNNAIGDKVEIMICDVQSYLIAMHYMLAFNPAERLITYWDEPTITMDYETHDLHSIIHQNWKENQIPNVVLSCATLPHEEEIQDTLADFRARFDAEIHTIQSYDCRKSIPMLTKDGFCAMPHTLYDSYEELAECVRHCTKNKTMLRYFDLNEIVRFLFYVNEKEFVPERFQMKNYFADIADITMNSLKIYYLEVLQRLKKDDWPQIHTYMKSVQKPKFSPSGSFTKAHSVDSVFDKNASSGGLLKRTQSIGSTATTTKPASSGVLITTADAYTLTDGPTIFLTEDAKKIGQFYIQQSEIPKAMFQDLLAKIDTNNKVGSQLEELERELDALQKPDDEKKTKQKEKSDDTQPHAIKEIYRKIDALRKQVRILSLEPEYVPNTKAHQTKWTGGIQTAAFCPTLVEESVKEVMGLAVDTSLKLLMLMGIGLFIEGADAKYLEVMKRLATQQDLFMIIASSDFVFGTNYNFCHGFIGKDMANMTQAKTIQCLGRIGRSAIQSTYTARFREDQFIYNLFKTPERNLEAENMSRLFS
jgi:hypothetical protein